MLLRVVTPQRELVREQVESVQAPGREGYLGILPGHAPLISELQAGELSYVLDGLGVNRLAVSTGFLEVLPDQVTVLAEAAERPQDIDVRRAEAAKERAEARLSGGDTETDYRRATAALQRALIRLQISAKK